MNLNKIKNIKLPTAFHLPIKVILTISFLAPILLWVKHLDEIHSQPDTKNTHISTTNSNAVIDLSATQSHPSTLLANQ